MKKKLRILIVDDHPMTVYGYEISLTNFIKKEYLEIEKRYSIDTTLELIKESKENIFDIILLDINMPPSKDYKILNGEDLGFKIKKLLPKTKIIILTSLNNSTRINLIIDKLKPNGFLIKCQITPEKLLDAIYSSLDNKIFYCQEINKIRVTNNIKIDHFDRKILYFISKGEKMKNLPNYIPLSKATIERRKNKIKMQFNIPDCTDRELLTEAGKRGYI